MSEELERKLEYKELQLNVLKAKLARDRHEFETMTNECIDVQEKLELVEGELKIARENVKLSFTNEEHEDLLDRMEKIRDITGEVEGNGHLDFDKVGQIFLLAGGEL